MKVKRKALDRFLGDWVLLEVLAPDAAHEGLAVGRVLDTGHGTRPIRSDRRLIFDPSRARELVIEDLLEPDPKKPPRTFVVVREEALVCLLGEPAEKPKEKSS